MARGKACREVLVITLVLISSALSAAVVHGAGIGFDGRGMTLDLGPLSPQDSPHLIPLASQLLVKSPDQPWVLSVSSDTHFRDVQGRGLIPADRLSWAETTKPRPRKWHPFQAEPQMVAQGHGPTGEAGASVSLDYRLDLGWDVPATGPVALEIQFTASPGVDLYASHVYPNPFRLDRGEEVTIGFYLPGQGLQSVTLTITTLASQPVYSTTQVLAGGQWQTMTWNGQVRMAGR